MQVTPQGVVTSLLGSGMAGYAEGAGADAILHSPIGVAACPKGGFVFSDGWNHRIRYINHGGTSNSKEIPGQDGEWKLVSTNSAEPSPGVQLAIDILRSEVVREMKVAPKDTTPDATLRKNHSEAIVLLEKQRRDLETNFLARSRHLDEELAARRAHCEKDCEAMLVAQQGKIDAVLKALDKIGPDQLVANAEKQNSALRVQIELMRKEIEELKGGGVVGSLTTFFKWDQEDEEVPLHKDAICNPEEPLANQKHLMRQLKLKKQENELEDAKRKAIAGANTCWFSEY